MQVEQVPLPLNYMAFEPKKVGVGINNRKYVYDILCCGMHGFLDGHR